MGGVVGGMAAARGRFWWEGRKSSRSVKDVVGDGSSISIVLVCGVVCLFVRGRKVVDLWWCVGGDDIGVVVGVA